MTHLISRTAGFCSIALLLLCSAILAPAQDSGPMRPPRPADTPFPAPAASSKPEAPPMAPAEMIRRIAAKEDEMARAFVGYTLQKSIRIEEIGPDNKPSGQMEVVLHQSFGPDGKLSEKPVRRSKSTLAHLDLQRGDSALTAQTPLFPLVTAQLPKYEIKFEGTQPLDELSAYFFTVKPRALDRAHAYFSGTIWVEQQDMVIVKMMGKWVTETGDVTSADLPFSVFETYRQQVGKDKWFPAYSRSDESMSDGNTRIPIRMIIRWTDYAPLGAPVLAQPTPPADATNPGKP
jgi:hypothetical protein